MVSKVNDINVHAILSHIQSVRFIIPASYFCIQNH